MTGECGEALPGSGAPELGRFVIRPGEHGSAVRREDCGRNPIHVAGECRQALSRNGIPHFRRHVLRRSEDRAHRLFDEREDRTLIDAEPVSSTSMCTMPS